MSERVQMAAEAGKNVGDVVAGAAVVGVLANVVPIVVGILAGAWYVVRFYEWARWVRNGRKGPPR